MSGYADGAISPPWRVLRNRACYTPGKASATTHEREIFTLLPGLSWIDTADIFREQSRANTARVLSRLFNFRTPIDCTAGREALWNYAESLLPKRSARVYNSALLDLGALVCLPRQPKCAICPVKKFCRPNDPQTLPIKKTPRPPKELIEARAFTFRHNRILLEQSSGRWHGMWILPPAQVRSVITRPIHTSIFPFTNHRITLKVFAQPAPRTRARGQGRWFSIAQLASIPLPSPHRRAVEQLLAKRPQKLGSTLAEA